MTTLTLAKLAEIEAAAAKAFNDRYLVTSSGAVFSGSNWRGHKMRELAQYPNTHGYMRVRAVIDGKRKSLFVHKLVAFLFIGARPSAMHEVRHLDGDRTNNNVTNLAWGTRKENAADRKSHGTDRGAENGRASAYKLIGRYNPLCRRGHDKMGRPQCNQCRREKRACLI